MPPEWGTLLLTMSLNGNTLTSVYIWFVLENMVLQAKQPLGASDQLRLRVRDDSHWPIGCAHFFRGVGGVHWALATPSSSVLKSALLDMDSGYRRV